jgi:hypothetical protein
MKCMKCDRLVLALFPLMRITLITLMDATADADFGTTENVQHSNSFFEAKGRQRNVVIVIRACI